MPAAERWLPVDGWPYEVSDHGGVRRDSTAARGTRPRRTLLPFSNPKGYVSVTLCDAPRERRVFVHTLVLVAFVGVAPVGFQANHLGGDKANNRLTNLEWVTPKENYAHAVRSGLTARGERNGSAILTVAKVREVRTRIRAGERQKDIAEVFGVSRQSVGDITAGRTWGHVA